MHEIVHSIVNKMCIFSWFRCPKRYKPQWMWCNFNALSTIVKFSEYFLNFLQMGEKFYGFVATLSTLKRSCNKLDKLGGRLEKE